MSWKFVWDSLEISSQEDMELKIFKKMLGIK